MFKEMTAGKLAVLANQRVKEREFWLNKLAGEWVKSHFPYDYKKKEELSHANVKGRKAVEAAKFQFTGELFTDLMQLSRGIDYAIHTIVTAGLILLMGKYSGCEDIVVGTPIYKQSFDGEFINMVLVLRNQIRSTMTFKELLLQVKQTIDKAVEHQNYPIEILPRQLDRTAVDGEGFPLFDVSILLENIHDKKYLQHIDHNVVFTLKRKKNMLEGVVEYNTKFYLKESIERMINHFTNVFKQALSYVNIEISRIDILSQREKKQLLHEFNDTGTRYPEDKTIHELFKEEVEKTPANIAVSWPVDLNDIYDQLESHTINPGLEKKIGSCCFKKNPYIYHSPLELPGKKSNLYILKNHRHNSVVVNHNIVKLIPLFDGKKNLKYIYSLLNALKKLNNKCLEMLIYSMSNIDLLEVSFKFNDKVEIFSIDIFEHFIKLVQVLYKNHLIELSGVHPGEVVFEDSIRDDFEGDKFTTDEIFLEDVLIKDRKISQAQVLLLGDTPGVPTTGLLYLASYLKRKGIKTLCQFYDPGRDYISMKENIEWLLEKIQPRVVAISLKWFLYTARVLDMGKIVKEYASKHSLDIKVVVGGNTASYYWEDIIKYDCIDALVRGDGEEPLLKICRGDDISNIPNCAYKKNGEIIKNPITYVQDKTNSSEIYLSHLNEILLSHHASRFGIFFIYTQKGCAMNCLYCGGCNRVQQEAFNRKNVFRRGVEEVQKDIMAAKKYTSTFQFEFDILDKNLADYCRKIWEGIDLSGHFCLFSTLTPLSTELVELVSRTFKYVYWDFDICTPSERHREQLESLGLVKPQPTDAEIIDFMTMCEHFKNIEVRLNLITGLPYFTSDDIEPGEKLFSKIMNTYSCFGELHWARLHAQPGAPIVKNAGKHNMHSYATTFEDFLRYSMEIFNQDSSYSTVEDFNYPYIYFNDDQLNSRITNFYLETNKKIAQYTRNKKRGWIVSNTLNYRQLNEKAEQLAGVLRAKGVNPGGIVGLMLERSIEIPVGIFGILKAGCAYMPIDPEFPTARIEYMLKDSSANVLVTPSNLAEKSNKIINWEGEKILLEPDYCPGRGELTSPETIQAAGNLQSATTITSSSALTLTSACQVSPANLAYVIYTSGTTGRPKGALLTHKNLVNYVHWFTAAANLTEKDKTALTSSFAFDLGYTSLYTSFLNGGELHILPREIYLLGERFLDYIHQKRITYIKVTPSLFSVMVNSPGFSAETCKSLRVAAIGGEAINVTDIEKTHSLCLHLKIMNHYGPTEATIGCVATFIDFDKFATYKEHPVIGNPIHNTKVYILGKDLNLLPVGIPGELFISGTCLARGYLNRPELTMEQFNYLPSFLEGTRGLAPLLYHTGDLACWLPDGTIEFLGRIDSQVKVRGYRVELGEIENRLRKHHQLKDALVMVKKPPGENANGESENRDIYLCAYIVPNERKMIYKCDHAANTEIENIYQSQALINRFQELVKKNPAEIAVKSRGKSLTYKTLNGYASRLAYKISQEYDDRYKLSKSERTRYQRQMLLYGWGMGAQEKLKSTTVFVAGAGGGASPTLMQLALVGFGTIIVCDYDVVELSNLNRQFLHDESRINMNKALSAQMTLESINPHIKVIPITKKLTRENCFELVRDAEIIFDMLDSQQDKFILSECALVKGIPHIISAMTDINGYAAVFHSPNTPCFHCIFDRKKLEEIITGMSHFVENYEKNPLPVTATSLFMSTGFAVNEAIKIVLGFENPAYNKFIFFNQRGTEKLANTEGYRAMTTTFSDHFLKICKEQGFDWEKGWRGNLLEELKIEKDFNCPLCGPNGSEKRNALEKQLKKAKKTAIPVNINQEPVEKNKNLMPPQTIALLLNHDIDMAAGILGALKSGKTHVPLNPASGMETLAYILEDSESRIILTDNDHLNLAEKLKDKVNKNIKIVNLNSIIIDELSDSDEDLSLENLDIEIKSGQTACMLYPHDSLGNQDFNESIIELYEALLNGNGAYIFEDNKQEIGSGTSADFSTELRGYLLAELPDYMVPSNFVQLDRIPLTPNGKVDIKALPDPEMKTGSMETFFPPRNEVEKKLIQIWSEVLKIDKDTISIETNFFEIGGHSLNATILVSKIHKELNARMPLAEIFKRPRIRTLSEYINSLTLDKYISIDPLEKREYYEPSSAQKRLYVLQQMDLRSTSYNMPMIIPLDSTVDKEKLEETFIKLIHRHENFRTSFKMINSQLVQRIHHHVDFSIDYFEVGSMDENAGQDSKPQEIVNNFVKSFDLSRAPLLRVMLLKVNGSRHLLMVDTQHITSDGTSHQILRKDFMRLYAGDELEPLRLQYRDFSNWQNALYKTAKFKQQEEYWLNLYAGEIPKLNLPTDYPRPFTFSFDGDIFKFVLGMEEAMQFKKLGGKYNSTLFMNMLAAFNVLLHKYTGQDDIIVGTGIAGRPHTDLQGIIGMFVNMLALRNYPGGNKTYDGFLKEVTGNCLKAFENQDVQFEALVDKLELDRDPSRNPIFDVTMVVQNFERDRSQGEETAAVTSPSNQRENDVDFSRYDQEHRTSKFDMTLFFSEIGDEIYFTLEYYTRIFSRKTIERLVKHSLNIIRQVIIKPDVKLSDIDILSKEEKQELLFNFNKTASDYPHEKTIHELFEEHVRKIPDNLATVHENEALSYRQLEKRANQLANYLYFGKKLQPENLVGILMERSIDQIIAILGVLKAGGAYLPIDFSLPEERIKNMIDDAGVGIVISQKKFIRILNQLQWECKSFNTFLCMDSTDIYSEEEEQKSQLMDEKLWDYVAESATDEITGGGWFSSYTGEPFSKEEMEEYGDNILKKLSPLLNKKMKVLEIGCGSGISMYRIAPHVNCYYGTDLSRGIIEMNKKRIKEEGHTNILLSCLPAHNLDKIETRDFDLVIINSVIQSFHGYNYLRRIIAKAIELMTDKGYFFIGDIMDQDLKENLIREMIEFKYSEEGNSKTKTDWSADLFVPWEFFEDLSIERTEIINVEYSDKIYSIENELTKFRYDTLLTIDKTLKGPGKVGSKYKYQHDNRALAKYPLDVVGTAVKPGNLAYVIYTSGSTGKSKGVMVEHKNVIRLVKNTNYINHLDFKEGDRFLLTGAFAFDITTFEIWGLLLNGYSLYMVDKNVILDIEKLREAIVKNKISVAHFIPQLLIQVAEHCPEIFEKLEYLLVGGDVVRPEPLNWLRKRYRHLKTLHMYGPTENTTFSTFFPIHRDYEERIPIGRPVSNSTVYILDNYNRLQPIGIFGELCLGGDGIARGYLNRPELTAEKFKRAVISQSSLVISPFNKRSKATNNRDYKFFPSDRSSQYPSPTFPHSPIYKTGDLARWLSDGNIEFLGRIDHQVKIRGFRVELGEIEARLLKRKEIKEAVVVAKQDESGDKNLYAYIVLEKEIEVSELREYLSNYLPDYMIPSFFIKIGSIPLNPNGKVDRNALLDTEVTVDGEYIAPRNEVEEKLVEIWSEVLNMKKDIICIDSNFFELGGHSLKATTLASMIHKEFDVNIPLAEIFKNQTVRSLSKYIRAAEEDKHESIEGAEKRDYYPLSPAQKGIFVQQQLNKESVVYNMPLLVPLDFYISCEQLEQTFKKLIRRHESLRTSFEMIGGKPALRVRPDEEIKFEIEYYKLTEEEVPAVIQNFIRVFDLKKPPFLRVGLICLGEAKHILMLDMHHIITDGVSHEVLKREVISIYNGEKLPPLRIQYKDYSIWKNTKRIQEKIDKQKEFWLNIFSCDIPVLNMPLDFERPAVRSFVGNHIIFTIENPLTRQLNQLGAQTEMTLYMFLLAAFFILLAKYTNQEDIVVGSPITGRNHADLQNIIGMFVNMLAIRNQPMGSKSFREFLLETKTRVLECMENQNFHFEELIGEVDLQGNIHRNPLFDVVFAMQNIGMEPVPTENQVPPSDNQYNLEFNISRFDITLFAQEAKDKVNMAMEYSSTLFTKEKAEKITRHYIEIFNQVVENIDIKIQDITISHGLLTTTSHFLLEDQEELFGF